MIDGVAIDPHQRIAPVFCVIPMGWAQSVALCQSVVEGLSQQGPGVNAKNALVDRHVAPEIDPLIHTEYAGNSSESIRTLFCDAHAAT